MKSVICNWKLNPQSVLEAKQLFNATKKIATTKKNAHIVVLPPMVFLHYLASGYKGTRVEFGVQAIANEQSGAYTGDASALQARNIGATFALVGHAEQRASGVTNKDVHARVHAALEAKLDVILAVGESTQDADGAYIATIREQITQALAGVPISRFKNIIIAYEPVWAVGAPEAPRVDAVHQMVLLVKKIIADAYGEQALKAVQVIYGGSVDETNATDILAIPGLRGVLIGRASLDPKKLEVIITAAHESGK